MEDSPPSYEAATQNIRPSAPPIIIPSGIPSIPSLEQLLCRLPPITNISSGTEINAYLCYI